MSGYTGVVDDLLKKRVTNSEVIYDRIKELGYTGGKSSLKYYIAAHESLIPAERQAVSPQGNRGRRYETAPGESYQMDWGLWNSVYLQMKSGKTAFVIPGEKIIRFLNTLGSLESLELFHGPS